MYQGNWKCSKCGGAITELPFQPRSESGLTCRSCFMEAKSGSTAPAGDSADDTVGASAPDLESAPDMPEAPDFDPFTTAGDNEQDAPPPEGSGQGVDAGKSDKKQFSGEWSCSVCGGPITSLPFVPRSTANLKCLDCFKKAKG